MYNSWRVRYHFNNIGYHYFDQNTDYKVLTNSLPGSPLQILVTG